MITNIKFILTFLLLSNLCIGSPSFDPKEIEGVWKVDLRPSPDAEEYFKDFEVIFTDENTISGKFYDTPFENGKVNDQWGRLWFGFTTSDMSGTYFHSGYLENSTLYGTTYSAGRGFLMPWTAKRKIN
mgnify:CR=1 FL=1